MKKITYLVLLLTLLLSACAAQESLTKKEVKISGYDENRILGSAIFKSWRIVKLKEDGKCHVNKVSNVRVWNNQIFLFSDNAGSKDLLVFDMNGNFVRQIGKRGGASNEYIYLDDFCIDDEGRVYLLEPAKQKILVYDANGNYIGRKEYPRHGDMPKAEYVGKDSLMLYYSINGTGPLCEIVNLDSQDISEIDNTHIKENKSLGINVVMRPISRYKKAVRYVLPYDNVIYGLNDLQDLYIDTKLSVYSKEEKQGKTYSDFYKFENIGKRFPGLQNLCETDRFVCCNTNDGFLLFVDKTYNTAYRMGYWAPDDNALQFMNYMLPLDLDLYYGGNNDIITVVTPEKLLKAKERGYNNYLQIMCCKEDYTDEDLEHYYLVFHELVK